MKKKIESKIKSAKIWKLITLISVIVLIVSFVLSTMVKSDITKFLLGFSGLLTVVSVFTYFGFIFNILKCMKVFGKTGVSLDEVATDLENAPKMGKMGKIIYGDKFLCVSNPFCVFAYKDILWLYLRKTTTHNTGTGATTTNKTVMACTKYGKKFALHISWKVAKEFIEKNKEKFSPDLILGYKMKYNKEYKELVKKYK